jgi:hypothetical protein
MLHDNFAPGDKLVETVPDSPYVYGQAFMTPQGRKKLLLVNRRDRAFQVTIPESQGAEVSFVDQTTGFKPAGSTRLVDNGFRLGGLEVAVIELPR